MYQFKLRMEGMGASDKEAPPTNVRRKDLTKSQRLEIISILRVKYIDGCFERGAIVDIAKSNRKISMIFPLVSCCSCVNNPSSS